MQNKNTLAAFVAALGLVAAASTAGATTASTNVSNELRDAAKSDGAEDLLVRVDEVLNSITLTYFRYTDQVWDTSDGIYKVDCSGYANRVVEDAVPEAYDELKDYRNTTRPKSHDYYYFFKSISKGGTKGRWRRPARFQDIAPGDLLVWRYKTIPDTGSTGHTTIVVGKPYRDYRWKNVYAIRVTDAGKSGHSEDNRGSNGSGIGAGIMLIKVDSQGQPVEYAWSLKGYFQDTSYIAMGRPRH